MVDSAEIKIWDTTVGFVRWDEKEKLTYFQYDKNFHKNNWQLSPIKMPCENYSRIFSFPELRTGKDEIVDTFKGLPGLLADALPDKYGNQLIDNWLARNGRTQNSMNPVEQLCFIGKRGLGALEFEPSQGKKSNDCFDVEITSLIQVAHQLLVKRSNFETNLKEDDKKAMQDILKIGTSAGGARPKALITFNSKTGEIKSGQADAPEGFEHWLIKLDGVSNAQFGISHGFGRVEYAYYLMAIDCGIDMMQSKLLEENGRAHFMTKRFDRESAITKHHIQTFCGIQHYNFNNLFSYSYEQLFQTMRILRLSYPEAEQQFRRMVFNVLATNYDDHTKNFSFRLKQNQKWELSPAYDICFAYDPTNHWVNQHSLSINGKRLAITFEDLMDFAKANSIRKGEEIIQHCKEIIRNWDFYATKANVSDDLHQHIRSNIVAFNF